MSLYTITLLVILVFILILWLKKKHQFWEKRGVAYVEPKPIVGNYGKVVLLKQSDYMLLKEIYEKFPEEKAVGLYQGYKPAVLLRDPDMIKQIIIKDFALFQDRGSYLEDGRFGDDSIAVIGGKKWKLLRRKLTPIFTPGKLKSMMPIFTKRVENLLHYVDKLVDSNIDSSTDQEMLSLTAKYALEVKGNCMFGIDIDAFSGKQNIFDEIAPDLLSEPLQISILQGLNNVIPGIMKIFNTKIYKPKSHERSEQFFDTLFNQLLQEREGKPKFRNDLIDFLIELKEQGLVKTGDEPSPFELPINTEIIKAQLYALSVRISGSYETAPLTMTYMLHDLACNQDVQDKAFNEIMEVTKKYNGLITYEAMKEMTYLNMVFDETLRTHPIISMIVRQSLIDYSFPNEKLTIPKGSNVFISLMGLHQDSKYFPNPEVFDPERFSPENKQTIPNCAYMPFGEGPRNCIGLRFAKIQTLVGVAAFLKTFKVEPSTRTEENEELKSFNAILPPNSGIWLKIKRR